MTTKDIHARLTVYEFLLEILYAREWANVTAADARQAKDKIVDLIRYRPYYPPDVDPPDDALAIQSEVIAVADHLLGRALSRSDEIRR